MMTEPMLEAIDLTKTYGAGSTEVHAVRGVDFSVAGGSFTVITGRSGSGKTTLLNLLGGLDRPTSGVVRLGGDVIDDRTEEERAAMRRHQLGFIFQAFGLLPMLTAAENVEVPLRMTGTAPDERRERARRLLETVGLAERAGHRPHELSGGEQQRVAIARALANRPRVLFADEPTGQLDSRTGVDIVRTIAALANDDDVAVVVATHDPAPLAVADRVFELRDGRLLETAAG